MLRQQMMMQICCRLQAQKRYIGLFEVSLFDTYIYTYLQVYNIFDDLPALAAPRVAELRDELARYLSTDPEQVKDVLLWWNDRKASYPRLSRMALDYLSIPGKSTFCFHM